MIPQPSEEDWRRTYKGFEEYDGIGDSFDDSHIRVIAHLARNLKVLAEYCRPENEEKSFSIGELVKMEFERESAIRFADSIQLEE